MQESKEGRKEATGVTEEMVSVGDVCRYCCIYRLVICATRLAICQMFLV